MTGQYDITTTHPATSGSRRHRRGLSLRTAGILCAIGGALAVVGATWEATYAHPAVSSDQMSYPFSTGMFQVTEIFVTLTHLLTLFGALGLAWSGLAGPSKAARGGVWTAIIGMALLVPTELALELVAGSPADAGSSVAVESSIGLSATIAAIGFTIAGIPTLRAGLWASWGRWTPLLCGLFVLLVLIPVQAIAPDLFLWPIAGWNVCLLLLGVALIQADSAEKV